MTSRTLRHSSRRIQWIVAAFLPLILMGMLGLHPSMSVAAVPTQAEVYCGQGLNFVDQMRIREAEESFQKALELEPQLADAYYGVGRVYFEQGKYDQAEKAFASAIAFKQDGRYYNALGDLLHYLGRVDEALTAYRRSLEWQGPQSAYAGIARCYFSKGDPESALVWLKRGLKEALYEETVYVELAKHYAANGGYDRAEAVLRDALRFGLSTPAVHKGLGIALEGQKKYDQASYEYNQALAMNRFDVESMLLLGDFYRKQGKAEMAQNWYLEALKGDQGKPGVPNPDRTRRWIADRWQTFVKLGKTLMMLGKHQPALEAFQRAIALLPERPAAHLGVGEALLALGQADGAEKAFAEALRLAPQDIDGLLGYGRFALSTKNWAKAENMLKSATRANPASAEAWVLLGDAYYGMLHDWKADACYDAALRLNPNERRAVRGKGWVALNEGRFMEAEQLFQRLRQVDSRAGNNNADGWIGIGEAQLRQNRLLEAREAFRNAQVQDQRDARAPLGLGRVLLKEGNKAEAERHFTNARLIDRNVQNPDERLALPTGRIAAKPASGPAPLKLRLDGGASTSPTGALRSWSWRIESGGAEPFTENIIGSGKSVEHVFNGPGEHWISLVVETEQGAQHRTLQKITVYNPIQVIVDGNPVDSPDGLENARLENGQILAPARRMAELLGATLEWDENAQAATLLRGERHITVTAGSATAYTNNGPVLLNTPVYRDEPSGRMMVPAALFKEGFNIRMEYNPDTRTLAIYTA
ncbi:tetratricopeptide repeat protein [Heliobacterium undosum]|uniref:Tetratricopeptide repeat protein n=1 Tax=Heliomicrobium undosum TaxID=121734 RepID=A0A845L061_9FIRM|nr:tetratricopeptide repeat protein [Heliomicrobium undosum]MZP29523.1 tetratricopeptide repeat protein [Heliomicrobium undosum]